MDTTRHGTGGTDDLAGTGVIDDLEAPDAILATIHWSTEEQVWCLTRTVGDSEPFTTTSVYVWWLLLSACRSWDMSSAAVQELVARLENCKLAALSLHADWTIMCDRGEVTALDRNTAALYRWEGQRLSLIA